jgi:multicomponent Na+:H+ antiporter subunit C
VIEPALVVLIGLFFAVAIYLLLSRSLIRMLLGIVLLGNGVNLSILVAGRLTREAPPLIPAGSDFLQTATANPLPQALILTAIVIGFGLFAFLLVLACRAYETLDTDNSDQMRVAEPPGGPQPPLSY